MIFYRNCLLQTWKETHVLVLCWFSSPDRPDDGHLPLAKLQTFIDNANTQRANTDRIGVNCDTNRIVWILKGPAAKSTMNSSRFRRPTRPTICPFRPIGRWCACTCRRMLEAGVQTVQTLLSGDFALRSDTKLHIFRHRSRLSEWNKDWSATLKLVQPPDFGVQALAPPKLPSSPIEKRCNHSTLVFLGLHWPTLTPFTSNYAISLAACAACTVYTNFCQSPSKGRSAPDLLEALLHARCHKDDKTRW